LRAASQAEISAAAADIDALLGRLHKTPLLHAKLKGIGPLDASRTGTASGPVARASGRGEDARMHDPVYDGLGFAVLSGAGGDALARLHQRSGEIRQSLDLIARAGSLARPVAAPVGGASGFGKAVVETPRGVARLGLTLSAGKVTEATIDTPAAAQLSLVQTLVGQQELGDALVAIGSLDLNPWEMNA
jgi:Ni,Fe-hydrogenase III large subunit